MTPVHTMIYLPSEIDEDVSTSISAIATQAVHAASQATLSANLSIVVADGDTLVELKPNGTQTVLKQLPPLQKPARSLTIIH